LKALLFDLDGVLIDSEPVWERVRRDFAERSGAPWTGAVQVRMQGVSTSTWSTTLSDLVGGSPPPAVVAELVIAELASSYRRDLPLIPGAAAAVRRLSTRFVLGLASGSPRSLIELTLQLVGVAECFQAVLSADEVGRGKPMPDPYLELARRLDIEPSACIAIEDSTNGLRSALAAQMRVIAIPRGEHVPDRDVLARADATLADISELTPELLLGLSVR
jgi:HAD superfamily hydrolase (TIGR01509 family)